MKNSTYNRRRDSSLAGKEIFEIKPVVLGGDPTDMNNKAVLTREQHIKAVCHWNAVIRGMRGMRAER